MAMLTAAQPLCVPVLPLIHRGGRSPLPFISHQRKLPRINRISFNPPQNLPSLSLRSPKPYLRTIRVSSSLVSLPLDSLIPTDSTRTLAALFSMGISITNQLTHAIQSFIVSTTPNPTILIPALAQHLRQSLSSSAGNVLSALVNQYYFFRPVTTPLTPVVMAMSKFIDFFWVIVALRVYLTWFNTPWDRQPFSTIKDLADPYLYLFRKYSSPIGFAPFLIDVSPFYATTFLDVLTMMLTVRTP